MSEFYDHPESGELYFRCAAGGSSSPTSLYDAPATTADISGNKKEYDAYVRSKDPALPLAERKRNLPQSTYVTDLEMQLRRAKARIEELERAQQK